MTISSTTVRNSYSGDGTTDTFNYTFKIFADTDLQVIIRSSTATETVKTLTTHYTVTGAGNANGGTVVFTAGNIPTATETVVLRRAVPQTQAIDYIANDPFPAESHEEGLDRAMMTLQQVQEEVTRSIKLSRTNTMTSTEFAVGASDRANKILAFDTNGELAVTQELGTFVGNWTTATDFNARDLVKDTTNNNIYLANTSHTSSGSLPISSNADVAKWDLIVDAASATSSATAAAASATAAASSATDAETAQTAAELAQTNAETAETNAETAETNAETAQTAAEAAQTAAEAAQSAAETAESNTETLYDNFDDRYLGAKASDPTLDNDGDALIDGALYFDTTNNVMKVYDLGTTTWLRTTPTSAEQTNINTVSGISSDVSAVAAIDTDVTTVAGIDSDVTTVAGIDSDVTTVAGVSSGVSTLAPIASNITTVAGIDSDVTTVATNNANVTTVATNIVDVNTFAVRYRIGATDPTTSLDAGDLFFNTTAQTLKVYDGSAWVAIQADTDVKVAISANDTTAGFLNGKLVAGTNITLTEGNDGGNETLTVDAADNSIPFAIALG
jgi:hypothetical protein